MHKEVIKSAISPEEAHFICEKVLKTLHVRFFANICNRDNEKPEWGKIHAQYGDFTHIFSDTFVDSHGDNLILITIHSRISGVNIGELRLAQSIVDAINEQIAEKQHVQETN